MNDTPRKTPVAGHVIVGLVTLAMLASAAGKLLGADAVVENFTAFHLGDYVFSIGVLELVVVLLYAIPKTSSLGTLLVTGYFGGAIVAHLAGGDPAGVVPAMVLGALAWAGNALRNRAMFESFRAPRAP